MPAALSRREFLQRTLTASARLGLFTSAAWLLANGTGAGRAEPISKPTNYRKTATVPPARYWVAANTDNVDCLGCHLPADRVKGTFYQHAKRYVRCLLCAQNCLLAPGDRDRCRARINEDGVLKSLVYGRPGVGSC